MNFPYSVCLVLLFAGCWVPSDVDLFTENGSSSLLRKVSLQQDERHLRFPSTLHDARHLVFRFRGAATLHVGDEDDLEVLTLRALEGVPLTVRGYTLGVVPEDLYIGETEDFDLLDVTVVDEAFDGLNYADGVVEVAEGWEHTYYRDGIWTVGFTKPQSGSLEIRSGETAGTGRVAILQDDEWKIRNFRSVVGVSAVYLHDLEDLAGVSLFFDGAELRGLRFLETSSRDVSNGASFDAIPADMGAMLDRDFSQWRRGDFELYSWNLYPRIFVIISKDYATQARFFKRLAFYVEKRGFQGRILSDRELAGRHGWNAHNYHPEDLASFFQELDDELLTEEERLLREILIAQGLIVPVSGGYQAGSGGIISASLQSPPTLREQLLGHEMLHGLYYMDEGFRLVAQAQWQRLDDELQRFWRFFLSVLSYEGKDTELVINEFQAYMLQKPQDEVRGYYAAFRDTLISYRPAEEAYIADFYRRRFEDFIAASRELHRYVEENLGIDAPNFRMLDAAH